MRNHINVVYVTSVLKKIIDVNRYLRRHTWDKPYQSSNCDMIPFILLKIMYTLMICKEFSRRLRLFIHETFEDEYQIKTY